ncbi:MAG TPA: BatD family protein, partial [Puia sp.]|nr:BatD family protein [Puia sp.]
MIKIIPSSFIVLIALLPGLLASGQVKFTTVVSSPEIGRGEYLQIEFVVENAKQIDQLNPPDFPGFRVVQGPIQSSGMSVVNGNMSQYKALSFVLQPTKTGKFTIGGAAAVVDGKPMRSNSITVIVNASAGNGAAGNNGGGNNPSNG